MQHAPDAALGQRLTQVQARIRAAAQVAERDPETVTLLAVSKTKPVEDVLALARLGQRHFGENYVQEALEKQRLVALQPEAPPLVWHFIGPIQTNKTRDLAAHFQWVHTVDRLKIARRLQEQRPASLPPLNVCLQVNVSKEASKSGLAFEEVTALAQEIVAFDRLRLRGLMAIPAPETDPNRQRQPFAALRECLDELRQRLPMQPLDTLSMGMSGDMEAAIAEGATLVRIGSALFGPRALSHKKHRPLE